MASYDIVIFQRIGANGTVISQNEAERLLTLIDQYKNSKKFIYMIDDLLFEDQGGLPIEFMMRCNAVICPNADIKEHATDHNKNVYVLRTYADTNLIERTPAVALRGFNVIWASTGGFGLDIIKTLIPGIRKELNINFICIGGSARLLKELEGTNLMPIVPFEHMISYLKGSQILVNPLVASEAAIYRIQKRNSKTIKEFIDCKSEIKYVLAGATHTAMISSKTASYSYAVKNNENGILVEDTVEDWIDAIKQLYNDENLRNKIIRNAHEDVLKNYTIEKAVQNVMAIFEDICKTNRGE